MDHAAKTKAQARILGTLVAEQAALIDELKDAAPDEVEKIRDEMQFNCKLLYLLAELQLGRLARDETQVKR